MLASQTTLTDKNLYAYCDNNPIVRVDYDGQIWVYAAIGGGIAGSLIGAISYVSSSIMNGEEITVGKLAEATFVGALNGAIGGVAGVSGAVMKTILIASSGIIAGGYTAATTTGSVEKKIVAGFTAAVITSTGTFLGTTIDTNGLSKGATVIANYAVTISTAVPTEITNIAVQQNMRVNNSTKAPVSVEKGPRRSYKKSPNAYVCVNI